ncbi:hypothetical protein ENH_00024760, partial [Eimeria necatrix]
MPRLRGGVSSDIFELFQISVTYALQRDCTPFEYLQAICFSKRIVVKME